MKKLVSVLLTVCILFSLLSVSSFAAYTPEEITLNFDYNGDGSVNLSDARTVLRVLATLEAPKNDLIYDITGNGDGLNIEDVKKLIGIVTGIDAEVNECAEFNLELFKAELNSIKKLRPGFESTTTNQCHSMIVTIKNNVLPSLNAENIEYGDYVDSMTMYSKEERQAMKDEIYTPVSTPQTVTKSSYMHRYYFPVNNNDSACFLTLDDIKSISCYEKDGYIIREVTMKDYTYTGDEYPTDANVNWSEARLEIPYGKIFDIPQITETQSTDVTLTFNSITFKNGKIVSKIDKFSGVPVSVDYYYEYVEDMYSKVTETLTVVGSNIPVTMEMRNITNNSLTRNYAINPVTQN